MALLNRLCSQFKSQWPWVGDAPKGRWWSGWDGTDGRIQVRECMDLDASVPYEPTHLEGPMNALIGQMQPEGLRLIVLLNELHCLVRVEV